MNWCPCVHGLLSFCGVHGDKPTPAETKLRISRDKWRAYAERLEKRQVTPLDVWARAEIDRLKRVESEARQSMEAWKERSDTARDVLARVREAAGLLQGDGVSLVEYVRALRADLLRTKTDLAVANATIRILEGRVSELRVITAAAMRAIV